MELYKDIDCVHINNNRPYRVESGKIIMNKDVCEKNGFHTNRYESLYIKDKFFNLRKYLIATKNIINILI